MNLGQLRSQSKELRRSYNGGNPADTTRVRAVLPHARETIALREAQQVIAVEAGYDGWRSLVAAAVTEQSGGKDLNRWFAVELNNAVWDLLDNGLGPLTPDSEKTQTLYAAYASTYHWLQAGNVANHGRGEYTIGCVAAAVGRLDLAAEHLHRYADLIEASPAAFADWDRAFAAEGLARLAALGGDRDAAALRAEAERLTALVADPEDRAICEARLAW
ncbi:hypothetical protein [Longispora albida]|uniref:hypothetical protein n=1 Tax=Longispora albida TaxID=203523 RepID=UPI0003776896|nr:hypothetical protein [Longispora albida]